MEQQTAIDLIVDEFKKASEKFPKFNSAHEGYAVLVEKVDELWDEIKANNTERFAPEAVQVGAMALRFLVNICGPCNTQMQTGAKEATTKFIHECGYRGGCEYRKRR